MRDGALHTALFTALEREDVHTIVADVSLPSEASISLHERFGFRPVGVFHAVGPKFDKNWDVSGFERSLLLNRSAQAQLAETGQSQGFACHFVCPKLVYRFRTGDIEV